MLPSFATQTVVRQRASTTEDVHGNQVPDWNSPTSVTIGGCSVQPGATEEDLGGREAVAIRWTILAPAGVDVLATDRIVVNGVPYSVDGEPARWGTGVLDHTKIFLKRWEG